MATASRVTKEDILDRAAGLRPQIRARAAETEQLGKAHPEVVEAMIDAGFLRIATPERFGGLALEFDAIHELTVQLARVCGSTSWNMAVWGIHAGILCRWPIEVQEEFWATGPDTICSASFGLGTGVENARIHAEDGGYRLSGHWKYASGCDYAQWVLLGLLDTALDSDYAPPPAGTDPRLTPNEGYLALVPRSDFHIVDSWDVSGLRGSGSKDIVLEDAFIPAHHLIKWPRGGEESVGWRVHGMVSHRLRNTAFSLSAPVLGMAMGMVDEFAAAPGRNGSSSITHYALAEAAAEVDAAHLLMQRDSEEMLVRARAGEDPTPMETARNARDVQYGLKLSLQAANRLYEASGAHTLHYSDPLQRLFRDAHAGAKRTRSGMVDYGRMLMGQS